MEIDTKQLFTDFFDIATIPFYLLGLLVFFISIIDDITGKEKKGFWYYVQDCLYSMVAVSIGISCCYLSDLPKAACWIIVIGCAFIGSSIFKKLDSKKESISCDAIDKVADATIKKLEQKISGTDSKDEDSNNFENSNIENN